MVQLLKATLTSKNRFRIVKHLKIEEQKSKPNVRLHKSSLESTKQVIKPKTWFCVQAFLSKNTKLSFLNNHPAHGENRKSLRS